MDYLVSYRIFIDRFTILYDNYNYCHWNYASYVFTLFFINFILKLSV